MSGYNIETMVALFPEVVISPHFEKKSFRVKKKIFATLNKAETELVIKLSLIDQSVFCDILADCVTPVPGGWGAKGWTRVDLTIVEKAPLLDLLKTGYKEVAPISLANLLED